MGRPSRSRALAVWTNGVLVGEWRIPARGPASFRYDGAWVESAAARPLSLSLPINLDNRPQQGPEVGNYFDNLLPDSEAIRRRIQAKFRTRTRDAFDLLQAVGRDCAGAVQLLEPGEAPEDVFRIRADPLTEDEVEARLAAVTSPVPLAMDDDDGFRLSLAGAQEKTAFTRHRGRWCMPRGATPTTHIFKLPLGRVGNRQADMRTSVENEWLCAELLRAFGVPVAKCEIGRFGGAKVLVVERFDRRLHSSGRYWLRLPQEDFCQATGTSPGMKYESDGGPGLTDIARILQTSEARDADLRTLLTAQLLFWLLAATDGHAKNFSVHLLAGSRHRLTPLYDVLSAWPVVGTGATRYDRQKLRLALAVRGKNAHYRLKDIRRSHFNAAARLCGFGRDMDDVIDDIVARASGVVADVGARLPPGFPDAVFATITREVLASAERLGRDAG